MKKVVVLLATTLLLILISTKIVIQKNKAQKNPKTIQGIILPHHGLAKGLLNDSFEKLKEQINPKIIVVYGTNHYFPVSQTFTTTSLVKNEFRLDYVLADDLRINGDHSIGTIIPYIKNYFPEAKIIPIIVSGRYQSLDQLKQDVETFTTKFGGIDTLYIASVDFAHDVNLSQGLANNTESISSIQNFNYSKLLSYNDLHMDSPTTISVLLMSMQNLNAITWSTWYSSHGALITNTPNLNGTSYVVGVFTKP